MAETLVSLNEVALERPAEPPFVDESWSAQLLDRTDSSRKAIIAAIFEALPTATTNLGHDDLPEKLLTICGSDAKLELMLQTEFMDGHSPIAWIILNVAESFLSGKDPKEVPPIFSMLLKSYGSPNAQLIQSIYSACCIRDSNPLLQLLDSHLAAATLSSGTPIALNRCTLGWLKLNSDFEFTIAGFQEKLLLEGRIDMRFIHSSRLYHVGFAIQASGSWVFFYRMLLDYNAARIGYPEEIHGELLRSGSSAKSLLFSEKLMGHLSSDSVEKSIDATALRNANIYVGTDRCLRGRVGLSQFSKGRPETVQELYEVEIKPRLANLKAAT